MDTLTGLVLGLHLMSAHIPAADHLNDANVGAYVAYKGFTVGVYENSFRRASWHLGYTGNLLEVGPVALDLTVGVVSGYREFSRSGIAPMASPSLRLASDVSSITPRLSYVPAIGKRSTHHVLHLSIEKAF